jgi:hypothetical protein
MMEMVMKKLILALLMFVTPLQAQYVVNQRTEDRPCPPERPMGVLLSSSSDDYRSYYTYLCWGTATAAQVSDVATLNIENVTLKSEIANLKKNIETLSSAIDALTARLDKPRQD